MEAGREKQRAKESERGCQQESEEEVASLSENESKWITAEHRAETVGRVEGDCKSFRITTIASKA